MADESNFDRNAGWFGMLLFGGMWIGWQGKKWYDNYKREEAVAVKEFKEDLLKKKAKAKAKKENKKDESRKQKESKQSTNKDTDNHNSDSDMVMSGISKYLILEDIKGNEKYKNICKKAIKALFSDFNILYEDYKKESPDKDYWIETITNNNNPYIFDITGLFGADIRRIIISDDNNSKSLDISRGKSDVIYSVIFFEDSIVLTIFSSKVAYDAAIKDDETHLLLD